MKVAVTLITKYKKIDRSNSERTQKMLKQRYQLAMPGLLRVIK